jgi:hypothetical protein
LTYFSKPKFPSFDFSVFENGDADEEASDGSTSVSDDAGGGGSVVDVIENLESGVEAGKDKNEQQSDESNDFSVSSFC